MSIYIVPWIVTNDSMKVSLIDGSIWIVFNKLLLCVTYRNTISNWSDYMLDVVTQWLHVWCISIVRDLTLRLSCDTLRNPLWLVSTWIYYKRIRLSSYQIRCDKRELHVKIRNMWEAIDHHTDLPLGGPCDKKIRCEVLYEVISSQEAHVPWWSPPEAQCIRSSISSFVLII